jgi:hypothetical protein
MYCLNRITCWLFGCKTIKSRDGLRWMCVRCEEDWLVELDGTLQGYIDKWLNDEAFIRTDMP